MRRIQLTLLAVMLTFTSVLSGCATLDKDSVAASNQVPGGNLVPPVSIAYDRKLPKYAVAVEPFLMNDQEEVVEASSSGSKRCINGECRASVTAKTVGHGVSSQLITALTNVGNVAVLDIATVKKSKDGTYSARLGKGERGPFILRGVVTEFSENVDSSSRSNSVSLGFLGVATGIAGAVTGNRALGWTGFGLAVADPSFESEARSRTGMIAFDVQVINGKNGRILKSFNVAGTFTAKSASNGASLFGIGTKKTEFAQSVLGQAMRVAMNDAVQKTFDALKDI